MVIHRLFRVPKFDSHEAVLVCTHLLWLFNVWDRSASLGREVGSLPRWSPVLGGGLVLRFRQAVVESKFPSRGVDGVGLLLQGWRGGCGFRGWQVDESSSSFPRQRMSTMASSDSWSGGLGGASPADDHSACASSRPWSRVSFAALFKAMVRWGFF